MSTALGELLDRIQVVDLTCPLTPGFSPELANLERLPPLGAVLIVGAPSVSGGSGGPSRILACLS
jgi:hypothetical protein